MFFFFFFFFFFSENPPTKVGLEGSAKNLRQSLRHAPGLSPRRTPAGDRSDSWLRASSQSRRDQDSTMASVFLLVSL